ncbi:MAG TPA: hypothetical protein VLD84_05765 [Nitrososphaeraceae archaeon]|nr:hypothetical protein [Nitrososphaeraceae archaeon]
MFLGAIGFVCDVPYPNNLSEEALKLKTSVSFKNEYAFLHGPTTRNASFEVMVKLLC